jgi:hypothetical protein
MSMLLKLFFPNIAAIYTRGVHMALSRNDGDLRNLMSILAGTYDRLLDSGVTHFFCGYKPRLLSVRFTTAVLVGCNLWV